MSNYSQSEIADYQSTGLPENTDQVELNHYSRNPEDAVQITWSEVRQDLLNNTKGEQ